MSSDFASAYQILHLDMGYDGLNSSEIAKFGLKKAEKIIGWVENRLMPHIK